MISDDGEYENEEKWLAECHDTFMKSELIGKKFMDHVQDENDEFAESPEIMDIDTAEAAAEGQQQSDGFQIMQEASLDVSNDEIVGTQERNDREHSQQQEGATMVVASSGPKDTNKKCGFKVEKPKLPSFSGNVRDYVIFCSDFKHTIETRYTKRDAITLVCTCLRNKPLELMKGSGSG